MTLDEYFKKLVKGAERRTRAARTSKPGKTTAWMDFCRIRFRGPRFLIVDARFLPSKEDGLLVKAPAGEYLLQAQVTAYGNDRRISRLRAQLDGAEGAPGKKLGETWTDTATTAVCDFEWFRKAWGKDDVSYAKIEQCLDAAADHGIAVLDERRGAVAPFVTSGFGDGTYPVYELVQNRRRVGFEIEFIAPGTPYPFAPQAAAKASPGPVADAQKEPGALNQALARVSEALRAKTGSSPATPKQRKANLLEVFQKIENELRAEAGQTAEEFRQQMEQGRRNASPPRLEFVKLADDSLFRTPEARRRADELQAAGFVPAGVFQSTGIARAALQAFVNPQLRLCATLCVSAQGIDVDLCGEYADHTCFLVTDNTRHGCLLQPPWKTTLRRPVSTMGELLKLFLREAPPGERLPVSAEEFARGLTPDANRHLDWLNDRGGLGKSELQGLARQRNNPQAEDEEWLEERRVVVADQALYNWLRVQPNLPIQPEAVIGSLVIVHEELTPANLVVLYWCATADYKARERDFASGTAREAFARVIAERNARLRKVVEKTTGLAADYYLPVE